MKFPSLFIQSSLLSLSIPYFIQLFLLGFFQFSPYLVTSVNSKNIESESGIKIEYDFVTEDSYTTESTETTTIPYDELDHFHISELITGRELDCKCGRGGSLPSLANLTLFNKEADENDKSRDGNIPWIVGGNATFRGEFPWLVGLLKSNPFSLAPPRVICGASLINSRFVLTAAHCIKTQIKERLSLAFNAYTISPTKDITKDPLVIIKKIKRLIPHPKFNIKTIDNDIGLIELEEPIDLIALKDTIRPVCLPTSGEEDYENRTATVAGWGYTRASGGTSAPDLLQADVPIISHESCLKTRYGAKILPNMLCAGYEKGGIDACTNDSGGPLVVKDDDKSTLVGVVSWGHSCALPNLPGVYGRVGNYIDWIAENSVRGDRCSNT